VWVFSLSGAPRKGSDSKIPPAPHSINPLQGYTWVAQKEGEGVCGCTIRFPSFRREREREEKREGGSSLIVNSITLLSFTQSTCEASPLSHNEHSLRAVSQFQPDVSIIWFNRLWQFYNEYLHRVKVFKHSLPPISCANQPQKFFVGQATLFRNYTQMKQRKYIFSLTFL